MAIKLTLNSKEILEKEFSNVPRGYDPLSVDEFLDKIMRDYKLVEGNFLVERRDIENLREKINKLESENEELKIKVSKYESRLKDIKDSDVVSMDNIELIKKINRYEKYLYQHGIIPESIKQLKLRSG